MKKDLTQGNILKDLLTVSIPIILTSFIQTAYNLMDMAWLGNYSTDAVSAAGTAGFFIWLSQSLVILIRTGSQVKIAHAVGSHDDDSLIKTFRTGLQTLLILILLYTVIFIVFSNQAIDFFGLSNQKIYNDAIIFLRVGLIANIFLSINMLFAGAFNGMGNSKIPLYISLASLSVNMILDPIFIYTFDLGVLGAALATLIAGVVGTIAFLYYISRKTPLFKDFNFWKIDYELILPMMKIGFPAALQSALFSLFAMFIGKIVVSFGDNAIAAQKIGAQVEALSWMTANGIQVAMTAFIGQNYGAKKWERMAKGYTIAMGTMFVYGIFVTLLIYFGSEILFRIFNNDPNTIPMGVSYLKINSYSQIAMIVEITTAGVFFGFGRTLPPSIVGIIGNLIRIPMAMFLAEIMGLDGIWWTLSLTCFIKAIWLFIWFIMMMKKEENIKFEYFIPKIKHAI